MNKILVDDKKRKCRKKKPEINGFSIALLNRASEVVRAVLGGDPDAMSLAKSLDAQLKASLKEMKANRKIIGRAVSMYADDETEIDDNPILSVGTAGTFVNAWVWVSNDD